MVVIGIHTGSEIDTTAKLDGKIVGAKKHLWKDRDFPFPVVMLKEHKTPYRSEMKLKASSLFEADLGITGIPISVLIDRQGWVVGRYEGKPEEIERLLLEK